MPANAGVAKDSEMQPQLKQDLEHITREMYRQNKELADTNRMLSLLRAIDTIVLEPHTSIKQVCRDICEAINKSTGFAFLGILLRSPHAEDHVTLYGWNALDTKADEKLRALPAISLQLNMDWMENTQSSYLCALDRQSTEAVVNMSGPTAAQLWRLKHIVGVEWLYLTKLMVRHHLVGLMVVGLRDPAAELGDSNVALFERLSESVGVALDNKLLFEENRTVLRQLKESNAKLRALDETKDDFISMASHQLRTPLTSVKGFLSMVIDGDAGKLNDIQTQMLRQAFASSQRMVYLITDLLNISRLKTGKFVLDRSPTDLSKLVADEVAQLDEIAQAKSIDLVYDKPEAFPEVLLDEIKTRQVIMNFIDNALYYTPEGGHITVSLANRPSAVELRVKDSGIGVPKAEQHRLFTKFYRATNARRERPDGTGLGLYMAQKVVVAQGGSIIFSSTEDKGSTFGFRFEKAKLKPTDDSSGKLTS